MLHSLAVRAHLYVKANNRTLEHWKNDHDAVDFESDMNFTVNSEIRTLTLKLADLLHEYSRSTRLHYQEGYRKLLQTIRDFVYFTNLHVNKAKRHMGHIEHHIT